MVSMFVGCAACVEVPGCKTAARPMLPAHSQKKVQLSFSGSGLRV